MTRKNNLGLLKVLEWSRLHSVWQQKNLTTCSWKTNSCYFGRIKINKKYDSSANFKHSKQNSNQSTQVKKIKFIRDKNYSTKNSNKFSQIFRRIKLLQDTKCFLPQLGAIEGNWRWNLRDLFGANVSDLMNTIFLQPLIFMNVINEANKSTINLFFPTMNSVSSRVNTPWCVVEVSAATTCTVEFIQRPLYPTPSPPTVSS